MAWRAVLAVRDGWELAESDDVRRMLIKSASSYTAIKEHRGQSGKLSAVLLRRSGSD